MVKKESVEILKAKDIQVTPQRLAIFEQLMGRKDHPSAEMIFNDIKNDFPSLKNMGLLATEGIYKTKLYDYYFNSKNISIIIPKKIRTI